MICACLYYNYIGKSKLTELINYTLAQQAKNCNWGVRDLNKANWEDKLDELAVQTKHNSRSTKGKTSLFSLTQSINMKKFGLNESYNRDVKVVSGSNFTNNTVPAFLNIVSEIKTLPAFLHMFYNEVVQRADYQSACDLAADNLNGLNDALKHDRVAKTLLKPLNKFDPRGSDKKLLADVYRAVCLAAINQVTGKQLGKHPGRVFCLRSKDVINLLSTTGVSRDRVRNALIFLRVAGAIHLSTPSELTAEGLRYTVVNRRGKDVLTHHVYTIGDFDGIDWALLKDNFNINLSVRPSKSIINSLLGEDVTRDFFQDLNGGVGQPEINMFMSLMETKGQINQPLMSMQTASNTVSAISGVADRSARVYIDQLCQVKSLQVEKMSKTQAYRLGYIMDSYTQTKPAEKLLVPTTASALRLCLEKVANDNDDLRSQLKAMMKAK